MTKFFERFKYIRNLKELWISSKLNKYRWKYS